MKRYWILFIFVLIGCTENTIQESSTHLQPVVQTNFLTKEEAIEELVAFNDVYYGRIKSNDLVCDIETCCYPITKGNYDNNLLAYVVNYEDDKGFAVISANRFDVPILVRTESGNLDVDRLEDEVARFVGCKTKSDFNISGIAEDESPEEFIYTSIANTLLSQPRISVDTLSVTYGDWNYIFNYGPHVALKWGQKYPFNMKIPLMSIGYTSHIFYIGDCHL